MQDAVDDDPVQLPFIRLFELLGISAYGVEADEEVARDSVPFGIVEGDDVGVIVMLQVLAAWNCRCCIRWQPMKKTDRTLIFLSGIL